MISGSLPIEISLKSERFYPHPSERIWNCIFHFAIQFLSSQFKICLEARIVISTVPEIRLISIVYCNVGKVRDIIRQITKTLIL